MLQKVKIPPGIVKDATNYAVTGNWVDSSNVRFRMGFPERIGGWSPIAQAFTFNGICRNFHLWQIGGLIATGVGTDEYYYVLYNGNEYEVTPIRLTATLGTDPIEFSGHGTTITVNHTSHGAVANDRIIISGATTINGIDVNGTWRITSIINDNKYEFETLTAVGSSTGTSTTAGFSNINESMGISTGTSTVSGIPFFTGGGAAVQVEYILRAGIADAATSGWGGGFWGGGSWGQSTAGAITELGLWTTASWGEDVVICARNKGIAQIDSTAISSRAVLLTALGGAADAPDVAIMVVPSTRDRHMIAIGATQSGGGSQDKMLIRWCSQEDLADWDITDATNTAGEILLDHGSQIITARPTRREILIWTDIALYGMSYIGAPFIFGVDVLGMNVDIAGINSVTIVDDIAFWIGAGGFYAWTGQIEKIPCPLWDFIETDVDWSQSDKIFCSVNTKFTEIIWHYPSRNGNGENDMYVCFEYKQKVWYTGDMGGRTAWIDTGFNAYPLSAGTDSTIYEHEVSSDDESGASPTGITAYIESAPFEIGEGEHFMFVRRMLHDVTFRDSSASPTPEMTITLKAINYPGDGILDSGTSNQVARSATIPVEEYTEKTDIRLRGRAVIFRAESTTRNSLWRLGTPRIELRPDGQR
jgi:hypothetical protein